MEGENNVNVPQTPTQPPLDVGAAEAPVLTSPEPVVNSGDDQRALVLASGSGSELTVKRKRGRPRKQVTEVAESSETPHKRGRGRPKGSGKWQLLDSLEADSSGTNFTPYIITVKKGEDIVQKVFSFSIRPSDSLCIMSANGVVSMAELYRPGSYTDTVKYQGRYNIVSLNGLYSNNVKGDDNGKVRLLSVQLSTCDGALFGGAVAGSLIVKEPTQVAFATFKQKVKGGSKTRPNNNGAVAVVPAQTENGKLPSTTDYDNNIRTVVPPVMTQFQQVDVGAMNGMRSQGMGDLNENYDQGNRGPAEMFDWSSSQHILMPDFNTRVGTD